MDRLLIAGDGLLFPDVIERAAAEFPDVDAFVRGDERVTYGELHPAALALARSLQTLGVAQGDVLGLALPSSIDYATAYLAAGLLGAVTTGFNPRLGPHEVEGIVRQAEPKVVIVDRDVAAHQPYPLSFVIDRTELAGMISAAAGDEPKRPRITPTDPVCIVWTSGTTGTPKGAWFDHRGLSALARLSGLLSTPYGRRLLPLPFAHAGFMTRFWDQIAHGMTSVLLDGEWSARLMLRTLERERVTIGQGVPTQWIKLLELPEFDDADLSALEIVSTGSAVVPPELVESLRARLGVDVIIRYACTEVPIATGCRPDDAPAVLSRTVGRPQPGIALELRDDGGAPVPDGDVGIVHLRSPGRFAGYWNDPTRTSETLTTDGWVVTSDLGRLDEGNLVLVGRSSDMYIRGGYNVHPLEVELVLDAHPAVDRAAVVGVPAPVIGEVGVALVVAGPERAPSEVELKSWCHSRLADYKVPDRIIVVDELPLNVMMKVNRTELRRLAEQIPVAR